MAATMTGDTGAEARTLVILVPGLAARTESWLPLMEELGSDGCLENPRWLRFDHGIGNLSRKPALQVARELTARIKGCWEAEGPFSQVVLVGHSVGGVLVREAYLLGCHVDDDVPSEPWAVHVRRIVLMASINRGFDPTRHLPIRIGVRLAQFFLGRDYAFLGNVLRGSAFITNLRIRWMRHMTRLDENAPDVIQVLGTRDGLVSREDSLDLRQPQRFRTIEIPGATHADVYRTRGSAHPNHFALVASAFAADAAVDAMETAPANASACRNVVFILHGIRANNSGWVEQVSRRVREEDPSAEIVKPSYGYFSALDFLLPRARRKNIEWFQDQYSYYLAMHPSAVFYFVGHSNGTYILGQSLRRVSGITFERAVLAGCVLPPDYPWRDRFDNRQLQGFCNLRARDDVPVGILCGTLNRLGMSDIGKSGVEGFEFNDNKTEEVFYYEGGHSAALEERNLAALVRYLMRGASPAETTADPTREPEGVYVAVSKFGHVLVACVLIGLVGLGWYCWPWWVLEEPWRAVGAVIGLWVLVRIGRSF
jgi:pimeloyl-ACP methyl ester carboxylesterase